ncbi:MAG: gamma carbonic anhydrase family protein [Thermoplasmata archaeon]|nr:gamma carbonic anhydrase family protein [Thermoplasmata archaeon]
MVKIHPSCYVHESAVIIGDVEIGEDSSVWPNAVIRGDLLPISIGKCTNIQDNCVIHTSPRDRVFIGDYVTLGHGAVVHGARLGNYIIVGMNAVVLNGADIGDGCIVGAGAVVKEGMKIPPNSVAVGIPAKIIRENDPSLVEATRRNAEEYLELARGHKAKRYAEYKR